MTRTKKAIYGIAVTVLLFGGLEGLQRVRYSIRFEQLRWLAFGFDTNLAFPIDERDGYYLFQPGFYDRYYDRGNGETYPFTINSHGFRGQEIQEVSQGMRVVVTGGSATFGHANNDWETWPHYLEEELDTQLDHLSIEVVNAGFHAYRARHIAAMLPAEIVPLNPDLLLVYTGFNDWETIKVLTNMRDHGVSPSASEWMHHWFMSKSLLYLTVAEKLQTLQTGNINDLYRTTEDAEVGRRTFEDQQKWNAYGDALESIVLECLRTKIPLVFATEAVHLVPAERALSSWHEKELWDPTYMKGRAVLTEMADRYNVPVVDIAALFDDLDDETLFQYNDVIHLTPAGNQTVASALTNEIIPMLQVLHDEKQHDALQ